MLNPQTKKQELEAKKLMLENAKIQLKKEFVGLDSVIEQITNSITSWLYFPELQEKPVVVNLWGLTGIGKTSLVKRLSQLLDFSNKYYHFDTNSYGESRTDDFEDIYRNCKESPFMIGLDEFQLARTINEKGEETNSKKLKNIWDILDSGKFEYADFDRELFNLYYFIEQLKRAINAGIKVKNGKVEGDYEFFLHHKRKKQGEGYFYTCQDKPWYSDGSNDKVYQNLLKEKYFVSDGEVEKIFDIDNIDVKMSINELREFFNTMNEKETIKFLEKIYVSGLKPRIVDCSKALIFVLGNLDEVYTMTKNFNTDISADEFHRLSKEITLSDVKSALLARFRSEQIARLGNNHIIYPAFCEKDFYDIIEIELNKIKTKIKNIYDIEVRFNENILKLIYREGVYPTQGCRPVFSTVHEIIVARLGKIMIDVFNCNKKIHILEFCISDDAINNLSDTVNIEINFIKNEQTIATHNEIITLKLANLSIPPQDDSQAIIAVHEAGHTVLEIALLKKIPQQVVSVTSSSNKEGFMLSKGDEYGYTTKQMAEDRLAILYGGLVAEELIFGKNNITIGSGCDITRATRLACSIITNYGFGEFTLDVDNLPDDDNHLISKDELLKVITVAKNKAEKVLENQKLLLLHIADYLSDNKELTSEELVEMTKQYGNNLNIDEIIANKEHLYFRNHLKKMIEKEG